ncbi:hypothetical protein GO013_02695 [Pseudodesulfovibrio sp. JC047]|uniref:DUF5320 domain-containing protein n=1 Tax=Pseudodesulfovibrio sp. JC047 TaxID=2683199 RepID=UPI0013D7F43C|nr:DUF5320 domain-containing protein [Pseudodesulfovibrio sp. JC047]NDV18324.1 hypothetical protein [Pseudodesulfovibrio sp. JC047]
MPGRNGTGPMGMGSRTGRGLGTCTGTTTTVNQPYGQGFGRGFGMRNGMRNGMGMGGQGFGYRRGRGGAGYGWGMNPGFNTQYAPIPQDDQQALEEQAAFLEAELKTIQEQLATLRSEPQE